jgi:uncharacterized protein GlcG (DUF336 family)
VLDGKVIGAIGVSGAVSAQDTQVANAGIAALSQPAEGGPHPQGGQPSR